MDQVVERLTQLEANIKGVVLGQDRVVREVLTALLAAGHVLVEGVPGLGKTLLVRCVAAAVGGRPGRIQFTPDLMPSDISGHVMFDMKKEEFRVRRGPVFCNFLLADEINRAPAKTQSALLEAMQEQQVTIEGRSYPLDNPFLVMATQNPIEQEGTYPLPQAQLDRFLMKVFIDFPPTSEEEAIAKQITAGKPGDRLDTSAVRQHLSTADVRSLQERASKVLLDEQIIAYAVRIARTTRDWRGVEVGAGPRGSIGMLRAARALALLDRRGFVTPDDVKSVAAPVLRHRIKLGAELEIEGYRPDDILSDILKNVPAPRV
jgi:MoxR-like ATPase